MNPGDMLVQGLGVDRVVPDIRYNVPCGSPTVIPGNLACDSRDLHRMISSGEIKRHPELPLDNNPRLNNRVLHQPKTSQPEIPDLVVIDKSGEILELTSQLHNLHRDLNLANADNQRLKGELGESRSECGRLLAEGSKLRAELAKLKEEDSKLSTILGKLDNLPTQVVVQASTAQEVRESKDKPATDESDVPYFVPSFPEPVIRNMGKPQTNVVENKGETPGDALRKFRKGKSS